MIDPRISFAISSLREQHTELLQKAAKVAATIASIEDLFGEEAKQLPFPEAVTPAPISNTYTGMTIAAAAVKFIRLMGKPQKTRAIVDALIAGGLISRSVNLYRTVYNTLKNNDTVYLVGDAEWGLSEWKEQ